MGTHIYSQSYIISHTFKTTIVSNTPDAIIIINNKKIKDKKDAFVTGLEGTKFSYKIYAKNYDTIEGVDTIKSYNDTKIIDLIPAKQLVSLTAVGVNKNDMYKIKYIINDTVLHGNKMLIRPGETIKCEAKCEGYRLYEPQQIIMPFNSTDVKLYFHAPNISLTFKLKETYGNVKYNLQISNMELNETKTYIITQNMPCTINCYKNDNFEYKLQYNHNNEIICEGIILNIKADKTITLNQYK